MDVNDIRSAMTVIMFVVFLGIVFWAFSGRRKRAFDEAANLPFDEDDSMVAGKSRNTSKENGA
ncbi:MAG: cbb3-type cytochrome c oxidase subunit 3 [Betaproteobacteria bacterium]|nr:cbb3-type cytochrome c oxidase subunit 3 [Betaproteobacteria bacterium]